MLIMDRRVTTIKYFVFVNLLFCALAHKNNASEDVRKIINSENELPSNNVETRNSKNVKSDFPQRKWISQLFYEAEMTFQMDSDVNADCKRDYDLYKLHLRNQSVWAVRMMESSEWPSVGIFSGIVAHFGNYDECLRIWSHGIKGQYCLAETVYDYPDIYSQNEIVESPDETISAWEALKMYQRNPVRKDRRKLSFAICMPSSCKPTDLKISLNNTLYPVFRNQGLDVSVDVNPTFCKMRQEFTYPQGYYVVRWMFIILFLLVISSTCYDFATYATRDEIKKNKSSNLAVDSFKAFSIVKNFRKLKKVNPKTDFATIHFTKILNILFVIYGHRFIFYIGFPTSNSESVEAQYTASSIELIHTNVVDVFFMISGFLTFHFGFLPMVKGGGFFLFFSVVFRWIRMVPVFGVLMLYIIYILPYTNEGPMWDYRVLREVSNCKESWWANLLAINNIVKTEQQCLVVSWYISVDIQLSIIGGILLYMYTKNKKLGIFAILFSFLAFTSVSFIIAYINKYHGVLRLYMSLLEEPRNEKEFTSFYIATYTRAGPYLIGLLAGFVIRALNAREFKLSNKQIYLCSFLSILISEGSQYYGCLFYEFNREYNRVESALFSALNRSLFVFAFAVHLCLYFTSGLGIFTKFFEWKGWVPFGRLTYSVFLVNTVIQFYHASSQKENMQMSHKMNLVWTAIGDAVWCYLIGLVLHLFAEAPISNLSKIMQNRLLKAFVKPKSEGSLEKINFNVEAEGAKHEKLSDVQSIGNHPPFSYHNESYVNNEIIPKISESSKF